jgi:hypothetical protein
VERVVLVQDSDPLHAGNRLPPLRMEGAVMPKVVDAARITTRAGCVWRSCAGCGTLSPLGPAEQHCRDCSVNPSNFAPTVAVGSKRRAPRGRRELVGLLAGPAILATRDVYTRSSSDVLRVAALVEISAAAAALARTVAKLRHVDPGLIVPHVRDAVDVYAVLGRGRWLPSMTRHVPLPPCGPVSVGLLLPAVLESARIVRRRQAAQSLAVSLFDTSAVVEGR